MDIKYLFTEYIGSFLRLTTCHREEIATLNPQASIIALPGPFDYSLALGRYSEDDDHQYTDLGRLVYLMKYRYSLEAAECLARFAGDCLAAYPLPETPDLMLTLPDSIRNRPFRPVSHIAESISRRFSWPLRHDVLVRVRLAKPQKDRSPQERLGDARLRYSLADKDCLQNKHILLFDDIFDTGRSLGEAAHLIWEHKPASVTAMTLVRLGDI